jgi:hypothetical protein
MDGLERCIGGAAGWLQFPCEASVHLWRFIAGWRGVGVTIGSIVLTVAFAMGARMVRERSGWLSAILGMMSLTIVMWWLFGILPSAWVYFSDAQKALLAGRVIPNALPGFGNFYQFFRDAVVLGETTVAMVGFVVAAFWLQKRYPRSLAEGEQARPQSGGYK